MLLCALAGTALVVDHTRNDSPTMDEPFHCLAASEYVLSGTYYANLEHPPLTKLMAGASLALAGARPPRIPRPFSGSTAEKPQAFCYSGPLSPERFFAAARLPFAFLFFLLVVAAGWSAGTWGGRGAAVGAAALVAFEPNLVAHAGVVHTDLAAALGFLMTLSLAALALERRSRWLWAAVGIALGLSLAAKFSAVFLVPILLAVTSIHQLRENRKARIEGRPALSHLPFLVLSGILAGAVLLAIYALALRSMPAPDAERAVRIFLSQREVPATAIERIASVSRVCPPLGHYLAGLSGIAVQNRSGGGVNFLHGRLSVSGFWDYFLIAFALKSSLAFLALLALAAGVAILRRVPWDDFLIASVAGTVVLFLSTAGSSYNIGIRHVLPVYPLLICASVLVLLRGLPQRNGRLVIGLFALLQLLAVMRVHPHELSFFNALAGGPKNGAAWLNDSNLDWGQDLIRLSRELDRRGWSDKTTVAYFGGGFPPAYCPRCRLFDAARTPVDPGLYAVSSFLLSQGPELMAYRGDRVRSEGYRNLRRELVTRGTVVGRVGYSIYLFRLSPKGLPPP